MSPDGELHNRHRIDGREWNIHRLMMSIIAHELEIPFFFRTIHVLHRQILVYVNGDSMYPILKSGDIIGYKEISSFDNVIYGEIYLVSFMIDGDEYLAVKYVNRSEQEGHLKLVSYNTHHEPMDIPFAEEKEKAPDCGCTGLYGRTGKG